MFLLHQNLVMCSDVVVGAYGSDRAVLLRTRSVLDLQARFDISPSWVSHTNPGCTYRGQGTACLKATACLKYSGINLPPATGQQAVTLGFYTPSPSSSPPLSFTSFSLGNEEGGGGIPSPLCHPPPLPPLLSPLIMKLGGGGGVIPPLPPLPPPLPPLPSPLVMKLGIGGGGGGYTPSTSPSPPLPSPMVMIVFFGGGRRYTPSPSSSPPSSTSFCPGNKVGGGGGGR